MHNNELFDFLENKKLGTVLQSGKKHNLENFEFLVNEDASSSHCLYIGVASHIKEDITMLCMSKPASIQKDASVFLVDMTHMSECLNVVTNAFMQDQKLEATFQEILTTDHETMDMEQMIEKASSFLKRPLIFVDNEYRIIASSKQISIIDSSWNAAIQRKQCSPMFIQELEKKLLSIESIQDTNTFIITRKKKENELVAILTSQQHPVGYLIMLDNMKGFDPYHFRYLSRIGDNLVSIVKSMDQYSYLFNNLYESMLRSLLEGNYVRGLRVNKWNQHMYCVCIYLKKQALPYRLYIRRQLHEMMDDCYVVEYGNGLTIVLTEDELRVLYEQVTQSDLMNSIRSIGISKSLDNIYLLPQAYKQAEIGCRILEKIPMDPPIMNYKQTLFYQIIDTAPEELVKEYIHPGIQKLFDYDMSRNTHLLKTLEVYIEKNLNAKEAAAELFLHRNTLNYRLKQIGEISGLTTLDADTVFHIYASYKIIRYLGFYND